jgi:hypothetical protein
LIAAVRSREDVAAEERETSLQMRRVFTAGPDDE